MKKNTEKKPNIAGRKKAHIDLALEAQMREIASDSRFSYEPLLAGHPLEGGLPEIEFLGKTIRTPIWVTSMTGGAKLSGKINRNLAKVCKNFGMGMGLGSCRTLLESDEHLKDFQIRKEIGDDLPLYANLGIAQVEKLITGKKIGKISEMIDKLEADGLIIHVNPLQEWLQPEGDRIEHVPVDTITTFLEKTDIPVIVKEVGQGMGYESLKALFQLPLAAIEFGAYGGTNFSKIELFRNDDKAKEYYSGLMRIGHSAGEMVDLANKINKELWRGKKCNQVIISGGIRDFLDGYYLCKKIDIPAIYGQASALLPFAKKSYKALHEYVAAQVRGLELANNLLRVK